MARIVPGVNDLYTWCINNESTGTRILSEWTGLDTDGNKLDIHKLGVQSNKYAIWICKHGHEWKARIQKRTLLNSGCPYCSNQKVKAGENDLETWCMKNNPELIKQFTGLDEHGRVISMSQLPKSTHKKVYWSHNIDNNEHKWLASISDRTCKNSGCPICNATNILRPGVNDLDTWCRENEAGYGRILRNQWLGIDENIDLIGMNQISKGSHRKVYWVCECGNIWLATPLSRIYHRNKGCPECSIQKAQIIKRNSLVSNGQSLNDWCDNNGMWGEIIKSQWEGEDESGNNISIMDVTYGSQIKMWWRHHKNGEEHRWLASIHNRTLNHSSCPICNTRSTSLAEQVIYQCFKSVYSSTVNRAKIHNKEFDIFIPEINLCIEYDGVYYHTDKEEHDNIKTDICNKYNIQFIRIRSGQNLEAKDWNFSCGVVEGNFDREPHNLMKLVFELFKYLGIKIDEQEYNLAYLKAFKFMRE